MKPAALMSASISLSLLALLSPAAGAGNNQGAVAFLSWDRAGTSATMNALSGQTFPLYVQLRGVTDVHQLAVFLQWTPRDTTSCGYTVGQPGSEQSTVPDSLLGWVAPLDTSRTFDGDWTYNWAIWFPSTTNARRTVVCLVTRARCDSVVGASFVLRSVVTVDSQGLRDTLSLAGDAAIAPHRPNASISLARAFPSQLLASPYGATVTVFGNGLARDTQLFLVQGSRRIPLLHLVTLGSTEATGVVSGQLATGYWAVSARAASGAETTLPNAINVLTAPAGPSLPVHTPTNDASAFTDVDLFGTRVASGNFVDNIKHIEWSNSFDSDSTLDSQGHPTPLLVVRSPGDTVAALMSHAHNGLGLSAPAEVRYPLNVRATTLVTLAIGGLTFVQDVGQALLQTTVTFSSGDSTTTQFLVGSEVRNWSDGTLQCNGVPSSYLTTAPSDPLNAVIFPGPPVYYDLQSIPLPPADRSAKVTSVDVKALQISNGCNQNSTSGVFGLALVPSFTVRNRAGQPVTRLSQTDPTWGTAPYGGFYYNGVLYNGESMIDTLGCELTCLAMVDRYFGGTATPATINSFLQNAPYTNGFPGYLATKAFSVDSVGTIGVGAYIRCEWRLPEAPQIGGVWAIQKSAPLSVPPIGVVSVESAVDATLRCRITSVFGSWPSDTARFALVYRDVDWQAASTLFSDPTHTGASPRWNAAIFEYDSVDVRLVEQALCDSLPVLLNVNDNLHWVLATGMTPYWVPGGAARGTYALADPLYGQSGLYPGYGNGFRRVVTVDRDPSHPQPRAPGAGSGRPLLAVVLVGNAHAYISGPGGGEVSYDEASDSYVSTLAGAKALRGVRLTASAARHDIVVIDQPAVGSYQLDLVSESPGMATATLTAVDPQGTSTLSSCDATLGLGTAARYLLNDTAGQLTITSLGVTDVAVQPAGAVGGLQVVPNPARGVPRILLTLSSAADGEVAMFDVTGRRLEVLFAGRAQAGTHEVALIGGGVLNSLRRPGLYFVRASFGSWTRTARVAILEGQ